MSSRKVELHLWFKKKKNVDCVIDKKSASLHKWRSLIITNNLKVIWANLLFQKVCDKLAALRVNQLSISKRLVISALRSLRRTINPALWHPLAHLGLNVSVVVVLEQQCGRLGVVLAGRDVQGGQAHFAFRVVLQQQGHHCVVTLLECDGKWGEAILGGAQRRGEMWTRSRSRKMGWECKKKYNQKKSSWL